MALPACAETPSAAEQSAIQSGSGQDEVVAEVGGRKITMKELDQKWEQFDAAERARVTQLLYQNRRNMLDQLVGDALIEQAAKAAGMPVEAYTTQETAKRAKPVTEADIQQLWEQNKDRAQGRTLEQLHKPMQEFLEGQRKLQARAMLVDDLREKSAGVRVMLDPPRYNVAVADDDPVRGDATAPITIVEFSDFQCPFCGRVTPTLDQVRKTYGNKVRIVFKDFPLPNHAMAPKAAEAAHCAGEQGKYWEMHDRMFARPARAGRAGAQDLRGEPRARRRPLRAVPRLRQVGRVNPAGHGARRADGRQLHAHALHQRPRPHRRAAVRRLQGDHRRRAGGQGSK